MAFFETVLNAISSLLTKIFNMVVVAINIEK